MFNLSTEKIDAKLIFKAKIDFELFSDSPYKIDSKTPEFKLRFSSFKYFNSI